MRANVLYGNKLFVGSVTGDTFFLHTEEPFSVSWSFASPNLNFLPRTFHGVLKEDSFGTSIIGSNSLNRSAFAGLISFLFVGILLLYAIATDPYILSYLIPGCLFYYGLIMFRRRKVKKSGGTLKHANINFIENLLEVESRQSPAPST